MVPSIAFLELMTLGKVIFMLSAGRLDTEWRCLTKVTMLLTATVLAALMASLMCRMTCLYRLISVFSTMKDRARLTVTIC